MGLKDPLPRGVTLEREVTLDPQVPGQEARAPLRRGARVRAGSALPMAVLAVPPLS